MRRVSSVIIALGLGIVWWMTNSRFFDDAAAVLSAQANIAPFASVTIEDWPLVLRRRYYSLPRCLRPGFHFERVHDGRVTWFGTLPLPGTRCGYRSNGPDGDDGPVFGVILGDSYTMGQAVSDDETYTARLSALAHRRFLNLGVGGQGLSGHLARWREARASGLSPRVVIVQLCENDPREDEWVAAAVSQRAEFESPPASQIKQQSFAVAAASHGVFSYLLRLSAARMQGWPQRTDAQRRLFKAHIADLDAEIRAVGASPLYVDVDGALGKDATAALGADAAIIEYTPLQSEKLILDHHWNEKGHQRAAKVIYGELKKRGFIE